MPGTYSVQHTKEACSLIAGLVKAVDQANADGSFGLEDLAYLIPVATQLQPAIDGADQIPKEVQELDAEDKAELLAHVDSIMGEGKFEVIGEDLLLAAVYLLGAVGKIRALGEEEEAAPEQPAE